MSIFSLSKFSTTVLLGIALLPMAPAIAADEPAQAPILPLGDMRPEGSTDPFSTRGDNSSAIMDLMHRAMRGDANVDRAAEAQSQRDNINDATSEFFAKRNQLLKPKSAALPGSTIFPNAALVIAPVTTAPVTTAPASGTAVILQDNSGPMAPAIVAPAVIPVSP
jgi:hypothetical protein